MIKYYLLIKFFQLFLPHLNFSTWKNIWKTKAIDKQGEKQKKKRAAEKNKLKLSITNKEVSIEDVIPNIISRREILYVKC